MSVSIAYKASVLLAIFAKNFVLHSLRTFLENNDFQRISLFKLKTGHYRLRLKINGVEGWFILDTGASTSCLSLESVVTFKLTTEESEIKAAGAGAIDMETLMAKGNTLKIGRTVLHNVDFVLFDMVHVNGALLQAEEESVDGILGADLLKRLRSVIDYGRNCLYIKL